MDPDSWCQAAGRAGMGAWGKHEPRASHGAPVHPARRPCAKASSRSLNSRL